MSEFALKCLRQAEAGTISKATIEKLYKLKKLTKSEYDEIIKVWENSNR